jgi:rhodanese-related sulfurtransferase
MKRLAATALRDFVAREAEAGRPAPVLLDVREPWETALGGIDLPGARRLDWPMNSIPRRLDELAPGPSIVCICHHGMRSAQVVAFLERQGYDPVYNLEGGTDAWSREVDPALARY